MQKIFTVNMNFNSVGMARNEQVVTRRAIVPPVFQF